MIGLTFTAAAAGPLPWLPYRAALARRGEEWSAITPHIFFGQPVLADRWAARDRRQPL